MTPADVARLQDRRARDETGLFFAAGVRFVVAAVDHRWPIEATVVAPRALASPIGQMLARRLRQRGVPEVRVSPEELARLATSREPQGIGVVVRHRWERLREQTAAQGDVWLALERVQSAGNLGTLLRTSEASGATGLVSLGSAVDPFDPGAVRASMGAVFSRRFVRTRAVELGRWARARGVTVVGATADGEHDYRAVAFERPTVIVLGSERKGLSEEARAACEATVRIPMVGGTDSLNLAVAGSLLLYAVHARRYPCMVGGA